MKAITLGVEVPSNFQKKTAKDLGGAGDVSKQLAWAQAMEQQQMNGWFQHGMTARESHFVGATSNTLILRSDYSKMPLSDDRTSSYRERDDIAHSNEQAEVKSEIETEARAQTENKFQFSATKNTPIAGRVVEAAEFLQQPDEETKNQDRNGSDTALFLNAGAVFVTNSAQDVETSTHRSEAQPQVQQSPSSARRSNDNALSGVKTVAVDHAVSEARDDSKKLSVQKFAQTSKSMAMEVEMAKPAQDEKAEIATVVTNEKAIVNSDGLTVSNAGASNLNQLPKALGVYFTQLTGGAASEITATVRPPNGRVNGVRVPNQLEMRAPSMLTQDEPETDIAPDKLVAKQQTKESLAPKQESLRFHSEWSEEGVRIWLGVDQHKDLDVAAISAQIKQWLAVQNLPLLALVCNGREIIRHTGDSVSNKKLLTEQEQVDGMQHLEQIGRPAGHFLLNTYNLG